MPFQQIDILDWRLAVDPEATRQAHKRLEVGCDCAYCRNFLAQQARLPAQLHHTLHLLGIDPTKPAEIVEYTQNPDGSHWYSWWYHAVGHIIVNRHSDGDNDQNAKVTPDIAVSIAAKADLAPADFPQPVLQIEFFSNLPWVLDEQPDNEV
ncbi:MAG: hypothetical protein IPP13_03585 [Kouleothrix sp.]|jgi:hypothetical protein|nr:hypothetical protein [Kouleothrix sp.]MBK9940688.1 hypothetical protein [Kouleothrix sp.]